MKKRTMYSSTLLAILGVSTLGAPLIASAAPTALTSNGSVTVEEGTAGGTDSPSVDPENPEKELPKPDIDSPTENVNTDTGSLVIEKTTDLNFGTIKTSATDVTAYADVMKFNGGKDTRGAYVQWADVRSGGTYGYTVTAELTKQFTSGKNVLKGSTIDFSNGMAVAQKSATDVNANQQALPSNIQTNFQLTQSSDGKPVPVTVVTADKGKKEGKGRMIMEFGQSSTSQSGTPNTDKTGVKLTVPALTASDMVAGDYSAEVTWKITAAE